MDARRRSLLAAGLTLLYPGLGHAYLRRWGRALWWMLASVTAALVAIPQESAQDIESPAAAIGAVQSLPLWVHGVLLGVTLVAAADAYRIAGQPQTTEPACPACGKPLDDELTFCPWCTEQLEDETATSR
jgi:hypothetical protein